MKIYDYNGKKNLCGLCIQQTRKEKNLTQADLAERLHAEGILIEQDSISRIEIGKRFVADYELMAISKILEVSVEELFENGDANMQSEALFADNS